jgi:c-di-GMP-binding flagellar brake protein YcgR
MSETPRILLVDDGELSEVAAMLERLHIDHVRLRGGQVEDDLDPPSHLLIATPRRASAIKAGSSQGAPEGRPLRIISVDEDSNAMRQMLRRMGFHLLVRRGAHAEVWRLLVERALFQGDERREDPRVPVGAAISFTAVKEPRSEPERDSALLVDISNRGCRLSTHELLAPGSRLSMAMRLDDQGGGTLQLRGRIVRCATDPSKSAHAYTAAMLFDRDLAESDRLLLARLLNDLSVGPGSLTCGLAEALPPCESPVIPGLTLDAETDPAFPAGVRIQLDARTKTRGEPAEVVDLNRRRGPRGNFASHVVATTSEHVDEQKSRVLMGHDLSGGGMRIEPARDIHVGERFQLAIYGPAEQKPFLIEARVARDDGEAGFGLEFVDVPEEAQRGLEKLVACLPDIESLEEGETRGLGAVISEILSRISH